MINDLPIYDLLTLVAPSGFRLRVLILLYACCLCEIYIFKIPLLGLIADSIS